MPSLVLPVPEEHLSFTRPALLQVLRQLAWLTEITPRVKITFNGYNQVAQSFDINGNTGDSAQFDHSERILVTITEKPLEEWILTQDPHRNDALHIFFDPDLRVQITPVYHSVEYRLTVTFRAEDKRSCADWLNTVTTRQGMNREYLIHQIDYHYGIPISYYPILTEIHKLREAQGGYGEDLGQWFKKCLSKKATILTDVAGRNRELVFNETQLNIVGWFDFTTAPEPQKDDLGSLWSISYDYVIRVDKPVMMSFKYPFLIHNQLLPESFSGNNTDTRYVAMRGDKSLSNQRFDFFRKLEMHFDELRDGIKIPYYDDWIPEQSLNFVSNLFNVLVGPDTTDRRTLLTLTALEDYELDAKYEFKPHFVEYFKRCGQRIFQQGYSAFNVTLYINGALARYADLMADADLNLSTTFDMDFRKEHHIRIGVLADLSMLQPEALDELLKNPDVCLDILKGLDPSLEGKGLLPKVIGGRVVVRKDWEKAIQQINKTNRTYANGQEIKRATVAAFTLVSWRNTEHANHQA